MIIKTCPKCGERWEGYTLEKCSNHSCKLSYSEANTPRTSVESSDLLGRIKSAMKYDPNATQYCEYVVAELMIWIKAHMPNPTKRLSGATGNIMSGCDYCNKEIHLCNCFQVRNRTIEECLKALVIE